MLEGLRGSERRFWLSAAILRKLTVQNVVDQVPLTSVLKKSAKVKAQLIGKDKDAGVTEAAKHTNAMEVVKFAKDKVGWGKISKDLGCTFVSWPSHSLFGWIT